MSTPAGWYDDGSGRLRWWDGERWTDRFSSPGDHGAGTEASPSARPEASFAPTGAPVAGAWAPGSAQPPASPQRSSVLGFVGLGLAVLGTVLACIPTGVTFPIGLVLLLAAFVVSLVAVFQKGTKKWPSVTGIILSVVGGIVGSIVFVLVLWFGITGAMDDYPTPQDPAPTITEQPPEEPTDEAPEEPPADDDGDDDSRPSPEAIGEGLETIAHSGGMFEYDDVPGYFTCVGQYYYDSDLSDESLQGLAGGDDVTESERDMGIQVAYDATGECDPSL
ncbi:DUF2510 domain-containing protein [Microbacterium sp. JB110]|uniref:DUF2510 domain-containing protein n=1 Tax=Microbacterium sp. JB110 TaxID=2024477 RepID=UPI00097EB25C|nr:DUF2510 domain-containing protein [Microbacterium sp. JB110]SJM45053.1 hypothetical protein CZ774_01795 [Frigoribacterium sp. JB110]